MTTRERPLPGARVSTAREIALALGGSGAPSTSGWHDFRCPAHDDKTASCGAKNERDGKIAVKCHAGCERDAILDAIEAKGLIVRRRSNRRTEKKSPERIFAGAPAIDPSLLYFQVRGIDLAAFLELSRAVRFARCWHTATKTERPALIAALTDAFGQVRAIQRLYLTGDHRAKAGKPMSLGKISGLAIKLGPPTKTLYIAEGLEDAMTAQQASGGQVSAAAGSSNMPNLVVPDVVTAVVFLGQNDKSDPTQRDKTFEQNLAKAAPKLLAQNKSVRVAWPPSNIKDANDLVRGKTGAALTDGYAAVQRMIDAAEEVAIAVAEGVATAAGDAAAALAMQGSQAGTLIEIALNECELFHDPEGECYASFRAPHDGGSHRETHKLKSRGLQLWLRRAYYRNTFVAPNPTAMATAISTLEAHARFDGAEHKVFVRTASHADKICVDLCDDRWRAIEVDAGGWRVVNEPSVRFRRSPAMLALPEPERLDPRDGLAKLKALLRIFDDDEFVLVVSCLLAVLRGRGPFPVLIFTGEPGATKTTTVKALRWLIDPNSAPVRSPPRNVQDVYVAANAGYVLCFNNLSNLPDWLSDAFCVVTEGSGHSQRALYTDNDESLVFACAPLFLTGVTNIIVRGDLMQRALFAALAPVPDDERMADEDFHALLAKERPGILGALLSGLSVGLDRLPTLKPPRLPRMATFAKWSIACETAFWPEGTFIAAYYGNMSGGVDDVIDSDKAVSTLRAFMAERDRWVGTATNLLEALIAFVKQPQRDAEAQRDAALFDSKSQSCAEAQLREAREKVKETLGKGWPGDAWALSGRLKKAGPALRQIGVAIDWPTRHGDARTIKITSGSKDLCKFASQSSHASQVDKQRLPLTNQIKELQQDEGSDAGRKGDEGGTQEGRSVENIASHNKPLNLLLNEPAFGVGDAWDANSADLSSLQKPHDVSESNESESSEKSNCSVAGQEGRPSDSDGSTTSAQETENRAIWRRRL
jgi:hypothetical protein